MITTQKELHAAFWQGMPQVWSRCRNGGQNEWPCDLRMEFCDFVEMLRQDGIISETLANEVTG